MRVTLSGQQHEELSRPDSYGPFQRDDLLARLNDLVCAHLTRGGREAELPEALLQASAFAMVYDGALGAFDKDNLLGYPPEATLDLLDPVARAIGWQAMRDRLAATRAALGREDAQVLRDFCTQLWTADPADYDRLAALMCHDFAAEVGPDARDHDHAFRRTACAWARETIEFEPPLHAAPETPGPGARSAWGWLTKWRTHD